MAIYRLDKSNITRLPEISFSRRDLHERRDLQRLLRENIDVISPDTLIIAEEFSDWDDSKRRIDLLGVHRDGSLVVIELKRTDDGGHMELQAIRYASMVARLTFDRAVEIYRSHLSQIGKSDDAQQLLLEFLSLDETEVGRFGEEVRIVLASAEFSKELTTSVLWLNEHELDIRCVRLKPYSDGEATYVDVQQVIPLPEAADYLINVKAKASEARDAQRQAGEWTGIYYVQNGERNWEQRRTLGFISAGGASKYSDPLGKLKPGDHIVAYEKKKGYVGYGIVRSEIAPLHSLTLSDGATLSAKANEFARKKDDPTKDEYGVAVEWKKTVALDDARTFRGAYANQGIVTKLRDRATLEFLHDVFGVPRQDEKSSEKGR